MQFHFHANQIHFHENGFALRLALKQRRKGTRKWPIRLEPCLNSVEGIIERDHRWYVESAATRPVGRTICLFLAI